MQKPTGLNLIRHTRNFEAMLHFYRDLLGLTVVNAWDRPDSRGAILAVGGRVENATIEVLDAAGLVVAGQPPADLELALHVDDATAGRDELEGRGATIAHELQDTPWGHRRFGLDDPDGLRIWFVQVLDGEAGSPDRAETSET